MSYLNYIITIIKTIELLFKANKVIAKGYVLQRDNQSFIIAQSLITKKYSLYVDGEYFSTHDTYEECWEEVLFDEFLTRYSRLHNRDRE